MVSKYVIIKAGELSSIEIVGDDNMRIWLDSDSRRATGDPRVESLNLKYWEKEVRDGCYKPYSSKHVLIFKFDVMSMVNTDMVVYKVVTDDWTNDIPFGVGTTSRDISYYLTENDELYKYNSKNDKLRKLEAKNLYDRPGKRYRIYGKYFSAESLWMNKGDMRSDKREEVEEDMKWIKGMLR